MHKHDFIAVVSTLCSFCSQQLITADQILYFIATYMYFQVIWCELCGVCWSGVLVTPRLFPIDASAWAPLESPGSLPQGRVAWNTASPLQRNAAETGKGPFSAARLSGCVLCACQNSTSIKIAAASTTIRSLVSASAGRFSVYDEWSLHPRG